MDKEHSALNTLGKYFSEVDTLSFVQVKLVETLCDYSLIYIF